MRETKVENVNQKVSVILNKIKRKQINQMVILEQLQCIKDDGE